MNEISGLIYELSGLRHKISAHFVCLSLRECTATDACWDNIPVEWNGSSAKKKKVSVNYSHIHVCVFNLICYNTK